MTDYPRLTTPIILFLLCAICLIAAVNNPKWPEWVRVLLVVASLIFGIFGVFTVWDWLAHIMAARLYEINAAKAMLPEFALAERRLMLVEKIANLPEERIAAMAAIYPIQELIAGDPIGLIPALRVNDGSVPMSFVTLFWEMSDDEFCVPVRTWASETRERKWAEQLTRWLISMGFATPASGNNPAAWTDTGRSGNWLFGMK